ncbi:AI-2E family transporter [Paludifilum halophilum]|uniref:AI-2E family transporter n=1 Tax=Paludifilum halophilum TaxID=1642702 RepID=A0A235B2S3_9BACL|nr:AI-2E family transporter [Paludifilum halophilum]OYD06197.1 AI-2E family transporter [Paludifilum halophilum]
MPQSKPFRVGYGIILIFLIIYLGTKVDFIFQPIVVLVQTLFFPFLVSGVLYYLFRPVVRILETQKIPRVISILLIYLLFIGLITLLVVLAGPLLQEQFNNLVENLPGLVENLQVQLVELQKNPWVSDLLQEENVEEMTSKFTNYLSNSITSIITNIANFFGIITSIIMVFVTVPFILFYMLKEGEKAPRQVLRFLPRTQRNEGRRILKDMDRAISSYIQGQVLVSVCVGVLIYIGFLAIQVDYSLLLALFTMFTNVIPFIGPLIGTIPALIVAVIDSPIMMLKVILVILAAQQIEGNFISPQVMGRTLKVHPLTIILLLLVAGSLGGFLGLLLAVPTYALLKVVVSHTYRLIKLRYQRNEEAANPEK